MHIDRKKRGICDKILCYRAAVWYIKENEKRVTPVKNRGYFFTLTSCHNRKES
jgi:hypothetical protein